MATNTERLRAAFESRDLEKMVALLDERVVWRGLPGWDYGLAGNDHQEDGDDHEHLPLCSSREEVRAVLEEFLVVGSSGQPAIVGEAGDSLVVDPRAESTLAFPLHLALTFRGGRVVLIQDYPDRATALADLLP